MSADLESNNEQIKQPPARKSHLNRKYLIVVLLFIFVFILMLLTPRSGPVRISLNLRVKATMKDMQVALGYFKTEYQHMPVSSLETQFLRTEGTLLMALLGQEKGANPRHIKFIDLPPALAGKYGLTGMQSDASTALVDPWGEMYYLLLDVDGDNRIPNPEQRANAAFKSNTREPEFLNASVILFSSGPDRDPNTWDDNICSWR